MSEPEQGKTFAPGSLEDLKLTMSNLQEFMSAKIKAAETHKGAGPVVASTITRSVCHVDGTTDGDNEQD